MFPSESKILKVKKQALNSNYVLTKEQEKYKIYLLNEESFILSKGIETDFNGVPFGKIEDIWSYRGIGTREYVMVFQKDEIYPIKMIDITNFY